jgi:hypothetical protein
LSGYLSPKGKIMITKLNKLTPAQEAQMVTVRDKWLQVGLKTEPANRTATEEGVRLAYKAAGLEEPKIVIWLDSPFAGMVGAVPGCSYPH